MQVQFKLQELPMFKSDVSPRFDAYSQPFENFTATPFADYDNPFADPPRQPRTVAVDRPTPIPTADAFERHDRSRPFDKPTLVRPMNSDRPIAGPSYVQHINDWTSPNVDPYADPRLPPADSLSWEDKDRFVRANGVQRHNRKKEVAVLGGAAAGTVAFFGGLAAVTLGAAIPLMLGGMAVLGASTAGFGRVNRSKPDGLRKHVFSEVDGSISREGSESLIKDLKRAGVYKKGRTRTMMQVHNLPMAMSANLALPEHARDKVACVIRFHQEDVAWRAAVRECELAYKDQFKSKNKPSARRRRIDPSSLAGWDERMQLKSDLHSLKMALPSRRQLARGWIENRRMANTDARQQVAFDHMLASLDRQAHI